MQSRRPASSFRTRRAWRPVLFGLTTTTAFAAMIAFSGAAPERPRIAHGLLPRTESQPRPERSAAHTTSTTSTTTAPPQAAVPPPPPPVDTALHTPTDVPDPSVRLPIAVLGRIQIPKLALDFELRDQITQESIDLGPSHWPGTAAPGAEGNAVIAGHRNSHSAPFRGLGELTPGDQILLIDQYGRSFTYTITEMFVVYPDAMWITEQAPGRTLTLFTCHPIGSAAQRLVVRATLA